MLVDLTRGLLAPDWSLLYPQFIVLGLALILLFLDAFVPRHLQFGLMTTVSLEPVMGGTNLSIVQEGVPAAIPLEMCYMGWQESLTLLALLVEANVPANA